jgi:cobalt-zinc-cadmium efflux system membrane fusion protein
MKPIFRTLLFTSILAAAGQAAEPSDRRANTVVLDAAGVQNLRIETEVSQPGQFEETVFALGRIEVYPGNRAVLSSRIPGSAHEVMIKLDHAVLQGQPAIVIESRQVGNPPPRITLNAPISGLVSEVHVVPGQPVSPDDTLAEILDLSKVYALARVPEQLASQLKPGQRALLSVTAVAGETFTADLEHLGAVADPVSGTVEAAFHVDNADLKLRPGMRAEFSIVVSQRTNVTSVPRAALQGTPADRFVYVKDFDLPDAFVKTPVVIGQSNDRRIEILNGLLPFDEVVTQGAYSLAFAGGGTLSLKEALDAAHGHEHNADGSELSASNNDASHDDHGHEDDPHHHGDRLWKILSGVLFVALLVVSFFKSRQP